MKLSELLEQFEPDARIKIGAADGSAYFYVGSPSDLLIHIWFYNGVAKSAAKRSLDLAEKDFLLVKNDRNIPDRVKLKLKRARSRLDNFVDLKDREVVSYFKCDETIDENVTAVIVGGFETGNYWCLEDAVSFPSICC